MLGQILPLYSITMPQSPTTPARMLSQGLSTHSPVIFPRKPSIPPRQSSQTPQVTNHIGLARQDSEVGRLRRTFMALTNPTLKIRKRADFQ